MKQANPFEYDDYEPPGEPFHQHETIAYIAAKSFEASREFKTAQVFCAEFVPPSYAIEPFVRSGSIYMVTAKTGSGKTALLNTTALAVATGRNDILGREVAKGRVAYIAAENPDDLRMRLIVSAWLFNIDIAEISKNLLIMDQRCKPEELIIRLKSEQKSGGPFTLIIIDTLAAFFDGSDANDNVQAGEFMRRLRPMTQLDGHPSVLVAAHPVKNASDDNLVPYGGGAILNEVDGNLTLSKADGGAIKMHWQGKLRGVEFDPLFFKIELASSPDVIDAKGRQVQLPVMRPATEADAEQREQAEISTDLALLRAILAEPTATQAAWGIAISKSKQVVNKKLQKLKSDRLVDVVLGKWSLTDRGRKAAE
jgi:archaellum biogenesis ATPase FlaH